MVSDIDIIAPTVGITTPSTGVQLSGTISVTASATDNDGVSRVEFYVDGGLIFTDTTSPYTWSWNTTTATNGGHTLLARAYDPSGNVKDSALVSITVDNSAPTVIITSPSTGAQISGTISVTTTAMDNVGVSRVEFYVDGGLTFTDFNSPYLWSWDTTTATNGGHTLLARAYDATGNLGSSAAVPVSANNPPTVNNITPSKGEDFVNTDITINGTGFTGAIEVRLDDPASIALTNVVVIDDTTITATVPAGILSGFYNVKVTTPIGTNVTSAVKFNVVQYSVYLMKDDFTRDGSTTILANDGANGTSWKEYIGNGGGDMMISNNQVRGIAGNRGLWDPNWVLWLLEPYSEPYQIKVKIGIASISSDSEGWNGILIGNSNSSTLDGIAIGKSIDGTLFVYDIPTDTYIANWTHTVRT